MISKNKIHRISTLKLFVLSVIIVFIFHPLSINPVNACSIPEENKEYCKCCCLENNEYCCKDNPATENIDKISCSCKLNTAESAEENENPVNLFTNIQKLLAGLKSGLLPKTADTDFKDNLNLIASKTDTYPIKLGIYLEISNLRI